MRTNSGPGSSGVPSQFAAYSSQPPVDAPHRVNEPLPERGVLRLCSCDQLRADAEHLDPELLRQPGVAQQHGGVGTEPRRIWANAPPPLPRVAIHMWLEHACQAVAAGIGNGSADILLGRTRRPGLACERLRPLVFGAISALGSGALVLKDADGNPSGMGALRELLQSPTRGTLPEGIVLVGGVAESRKAQLRRLLRGEYLFGTPAAQKQHQQPTPYPSGGRKNRRAATAVSSDSSCSISARLHRRLCTQCSSGTPSRAPSTKSNRTHTSGCCG
jgi:hypothetical protein